MASYNNSTLERRAKTYRTEVLSSALPPLTYSRTRSGFALCAWLLCVFVGYTSGCNARTTDEPEFHTLNEFHSTRRYYPTDKWHKIANPALMGWSVDKLNAARAYADKLDTAAVMIVDNGVVVAAWGDTGKRYKCHSIRKSLLNSLYGVHVRLGNIDISRTLADVGIDDVEPSLSEKEKQAKIGDLLKSRSGVYHAAAYETESMRRNRPERGTHPPGTFFFYNNWDFNALLTVFEKQSQTKFFREFKRRIAEPLEMEHFRLRDTKYINSSRSVHPAYVFRMSARDLARFGLLYLRNGRWRDRQILTESWVQESTVAYSRTDRSGFGYLWWIYDDYYAAAGRRGHRLFVYPKYDLVVVHRVNTDNKEHGVKDRRVRKLLKLIIEARDKGS